MYQTIGLEVESYGWVSFVRVIYSYNDGWLCFQEMKFDTVQLAYDWIANLALDCLAPDCGHVTFLLGRLTPRM